MFVVVVLGEFFGVYFFSPRAPGLVEFRSSGRRLMFLWYFARVNRMIYLNIRISQYG